MGDHHVDEVSGAATEIASLQTALIEALIVIDTALEDVKAAARRAGMEDAVADLEEVEHVSI